MEAPSQPGCDTGPVSKEPLQAPRGTRDFYPEDLRLRNWLFDNGAVVIGIDRRIAVYLQQEGVSARQLLAQVKDFSLPQKSQTYTSLANQLEGQGDHQISRIFYNKARELAGFEQ